MARLGHHPHRIHLPIVLVLLLAATPAALMLTAGQVMPVAARAVQVRTRAPLVHYPADQAGHPSAQNEWWYVVGHVRNGRRSFGYEVTIFKFQNVKPPGSSTPVSIYRTDLAITDEAAGRFHQRVTYYFPDSASVSSTTLNVRVGNASLRAGPRNSMDLAASFAGGKIDLHLISRRSPMYVGGNGYIPFGQSYTYYYSLTDLATSGSLTVGRRSISVHGLSWLDHQWGNWSWTGVQGWQWMALQLSNGVQMSVFDLRGGRKPLRMASVSSPDGRTATVSGVSISPLGTWVSPNTHARYPSGWSVRIPALRAAMRVLPAVRDQELIVPYPVRGTYWEGSGRVSGSYEGRPITGLSYTELTGYVKK